MGNAYAGKAASAEDASTVFFNPAAMTTFKTFSVVAGFEVLSSSSSFTDQGSTGSPFLPNAGATGGDGGDPGGTSFLPQVYLVAPLSDRWAVGFGVNTPFGLTTEYNETWQGRYNAVKSMLEVVDLMGTVAFRLNENLSLGAGIDYQMARAELTNMVDYGSAFAQFGTIPQTQDGLASLESDTSGAFGFNVSALIEFSERTRLGINYRSEVEHDLEGDATFGTNATVRGILAQLPASMRPFTPTTGYATITLPQQIYVSGYHEIDDQWAILGDVTWTGWDSFEELKITFDNPAQPESVKEENWENAWRFSLGTTFRPDPKWALRFGVAYDMTPIEDDYRTPRIPTSNRVWVALGVGYQFTEWMCVDLSYMHVFIDDGDVNDSVATGQVLRGTFEESTADVFGLQFTFAF
jgi:long-chain fatty acid transport protein